MVTHSCYWFNQPKQKASDKCLKSEGNYPKCVGIRGIQATKGAISLQHCYVSKLNPRNNITLQITTTI